MHPSWKGVTIKIRSTGKEVTLLDQDASGNVIVLLDGVETKFHLLEIELPEPELKIIIGD